MPSLYETTTNPGDVSSSDFTTLYNASGLTVPNAGAGAVTGAEGAGAAGAGAAGGGRPHRRQGAGARSSQTLPLVRRAGGRSGGMAEFGVARLRWRPTGRLCAGHGPAGAARGAAAERDRHAAARQDAGRRVRARRHERGGGVTARAGAPRDDRRPQAKSAAAAAGVGADVGSSGGLRRPAGTCRRPS